MVEESGAMSEAWTVEASHYPLHDRWIRVRADTCRTPTGVRVAPYYVLECPDFVHVLVLDEQDQVVLVRQYRHGMAAASLELPGGVMDPGESDPCMTAARELREETGYTGGEVAYVTSLSLDPARYTNRLHLVRVSGARPGPAEPDPSEGITVVRVTRAEARRLALSGTIMNAAHIGLLLIGLEQS